jgi:adenosylhomocysteinase
MGANVIVTEIDPMRALEALMDGYRVMPMEDAAKVGDIFITATGDIHVLDEHHFASMKSGAIVANSGHFNVEINIPALERLSKGGARLVRPFVEEYMVNGKRPVYVLGEGRLINLAAAEGHPASVMDMSFANQALAAEFMLINGSNLQPEVYTIPEEIDREIARLKLEAMGIKIDKLTSEQEHYLNQWEEGT